MTNMHLQRSRGVATCIGVLVLIYTQVDLVYSRVLVRRAYADIAGMDICLVPTIWAYRDALWLALAGSLLVLVGSVAETGRGWFGRRATWHLLLGGAVCATVLVLSKSLTKLRGICFVLDPDGGGTLTFGTLQTAIGEWWTLDGFNLNGPRDLTRVTVAILVLGVVSSLVLKAVWHRPDSSS
jgi:hypothetical protein